MQKTTSWGPHLAATADDSVMISTESQRSRYRVSGKSIGPDSDGTDESFAERQSDPPKAGRPQGSDVGPLAQAKQRSKHLAGLTPPGTVAELPSIESSLTDAPIEDAVKPSAADIDWANFVYAYARGRWNPVKPPMPPGRSSAFPGAVTRIILPPASTMAGSSNSVSKDTPAIVTPGRRPSLGYDELSQDVATVAAPADGSHPSEPVHSGSSSAMPATNQWYPGRPASGSGPSSQQMADQSTPSDDTSPFQASRLESTHQQGLSPVAEGSVKLDRNLSRDAERGDLLTPSLQYEKVRQDGQTHSDNKADQTSQSAAEHALIHFATSSTPELHQATRRAAHAQDVLHHSASRPASNFANVSDGSNSTIARTTHSATDSIPRTSNPRRGFADDGATVLDPSVWSRRVKQDGQYDDVGPSPRQESSDIDPASTVGPHSDRIPPSNSSAHGKMRREVAESQSPARPGPTPVQLPDIPGLSLLKKGEIPAVWQSAPEGFLTSWRFPEFGEEDSRGVEHLDHEALLASRAEEGSTVAGLRRAARRSSLLRPEEGSLPTATSKSINRHANSWSSEPGRSWTVPAPAVPTVMALAPAAGVLSCPPDEEDSGAPSRHAGQKPVHPDVFDDVDSATSQQTLSQALQDKSRANELLKDRNTTPGGNIQVPCFFPSLGNTACEPLLGANASPSSSTYLSAGQQAEQFYFERGYLPAVLPPSEGQRRRALARYGPPKISGDVNFDRIGHLVRLVFNTKIVLVSLVGTNSQMFQSVVGGGAELDQAILQRIAGSRYCSFCGHAILQQSDEPLVILDAAKDWRFMGNPLVVGSPHVRFYAGCPLRTQDGYNLGSLCIIDMEPRQEFSPRLRHTLKEFSRIVMRELELTRDHIHLKARDRMQKSIEHFTRDCIEMATDNVATSHDERGSGPSGLTALYDSAAHTIRETLQVAGAIVFDLSHFELIESPATDGNKAKASSSKIFFPSPFSMPDATPYANFDDPSDIQTINSPPGVTDEAIKTQAVPAMGILGVDESTNAPKGREQPVPLSDHIRIAEFLRRYRTGCFFSVVPNVFKALLPEGTSNMLLVPIFGLNKQPFALLCAYAMPATDEALLEDVKDSALQYMRSMGTIILSAVLKKDLMLADQAKSHFISNISHELRTPLHGILASAELLAETKLNTTQGSFLDTIEACGKSLLELVNHVLDFTKLSGSAKTKGSAGQTLSPCDLVKLVQEVCESSWIGQMAKKLDSQQTSGIGSAYASGAASINMGSGHPAGAGKIKRLAAGDVETVVDVSLRQAGWLVTCDVGGIRRVLMNLIGNSLKFTNSGFVHISLREVQSTTSHIVVELSVCDTGRGISKAFLEEQLFHPFTQENQYGPGTGLGLSIVNSIVQSPSINGKIDVWSTLGEGTEMRITCEMALADVEEIDGAVYQPALNLKEGRSVSLAGFTQARGQIDLKQVLSSYFHHWWHFAKSDTGDLGGDVVLINEDITILDKLAKVRDPLPPVILLSSAMGDSSIAEACEDYHRRGGVARMTFKPVGPAKLEAVVDFCLQCLDRYERGEVPESEQTKPSTPLPSPMHRPAMEAADSYFGGAVEDGYGGEDHSVDATDDVATPAASVKTPTAGAPLREGADLTPSAVEIPAGSRPPLLPQSRGSHHVSPGLPDAASALIRRHSTEDEISRRRMAASAQSSDGKDGPEDQVVAVVHKGALPQRPFLPPRSITFHQEPRLDKHVALSPSLLRDAGAADYFSVRKHNSSASSQESGSPAVSERDGHVKGKASLGTTRSPASPGSAIRIDGSESLVLRSALGTVMKELRSSSPRERSAQGRTSRTRIRVLGVDDNEINMRILAAFMAKFDVDFVPAHDGQECIDLFEKAEPSFDIVVLDITMPIIDGYQATAIIRQKEAERAERAGKVLSAMPRVKVVCLTGHSTEEDKRKAFACGADGFMTRPLSLRVLTALMRLLTQTSGQA